MTLFRAKEIAAGVVIAAVFVFTGCATDPIADDVAPTSDATVQDAQPTTDTADAEMPAVATESDCLIGSWELVNASFEAALTAMLQDDPAVPADMLASLSISLSGKSALRFGADGQYGAWQDEYTMTIGTGGETMQHTQNSADIAAYEADAESVRVTGFQQLYVEAEMRIGDSIAVEIPNGNASMASISFFGHTADVSTNPRELIDGAAQYACTSDKLTLQAEGFPSAAEFVRIADITRE